jgi:ABC-type lipoprotein release transport system permease subunit
VALRLARGALLGVPAVEARAILAIAVMTGAIAALAALLPARRASRIDVAELLRLE